MMGNNYFMQKYVMEASQKKKKPSRMTLLQDRANAGLDEEDAASAALENEGTARALAFDPNEALGRYTEGVLAKSRQSLADSLEELSYGSAAAGRLNTGLYDRDRGDVARRVYQDANSNLQMASLDASRMEQDQGQFLVGAGDARRSRYFDRVYSNIDQERLNQAAKARKKKGGFWSAVSGIAGAALGSAIPGIGTAVGGAIGSALAPKSTYG